MVVSHAGLTAATKGQILHAHLGDTVVETDATGMGFVQDALAALIVPVEIIERQRPRPVIDVIDGLVQ